MVQIETKFLLQKDFLHRAIALDPPGDSEIVRLPTPKLCHLRKDAMNIGAEPSQRFANELGKRRPTCLSR